MNDYRIFLIIFKNFYMKYKRFQIIKKSFKEIIKKLFKKTIKNLILFLIFKKTKKRHFLLNRKCLN